MITVKPFKFLISFSHAFVYSLVAFAFSVSAHSLPGSELVFKDINSKTGITLSFPLEEFVIAAPHLKFVENASNLGDLTSNEANQLARYFNQHFKVKSVNEGQKNQFIPPSLHSIEINDRFNEHVGHYRRVEVLFALASNALTYNSLFPVALHFDAILHEIRSHRVAVFYEDKQNRKIKLVDFVYSEADGKPTVHLLSPDR